MTFSEIENLTFAELKARRDEIAQAAFENEGRDQLALRYVQARTDAKQRDEKLSEQGKMIDALSSGNAALLEKVATLERANADLSKQLSAAFARVSEKIVELQAEHQATGAEMMRADRAEELARDRRRALASVVNLLTPLLVQE